MRQNDNNLAPGDMVSGLGIHRYGQAGDVWVYNLVAQNTREGSVLQKVLSKLDVMREQMGSDRVCDVIDEWLEDVPLVRLIGLRRAGARQGKSVERYPLPHLSSESSR